MAQRGSRVLHIHTGDGTLAAEIDRRLAENSSETVHCRDVFDAAATLVTQYDLVPELVFVGADWLSADELDLLRYVRETWPGTELVLYGSHRGHELPTEMRVRLCKSLAEVREVFSRAETRVAASTLPPISTLEPASADDSGSLCIAPLPEPSAIASEPAGAPIRRAIASAAGRVELTDAEREALLGLRWR